MEALSVKELLAQAAATPLPHYNKSTVVCPLPGDGLDRYLLRIKVPFLFTKDLEATSSLSPIGYIDKNYGQPLLQGTKEFQIVLKKPGQSLWHLFQEKAHTPGMDATQETDTAHMHVLGLLDALPMSSFVDLAKQVNYLSARGIAADFLSNNIMLDGAKLHLIDIDNGSNYRVNNLSSLQNKWLDFYPFPDKKFYSAAVDSFSNRVQLKMEEAAHIAGLPHNPLEVELAFPPSKIVFRTPVRIDSIATLPLSATPLELRERLRDVERHIGTLLG
jgi:hypothetical protein